MDIITNQRVTHIYQQMQLCDSCGKKVTLMENVYYCHDPTQLVCAKCAKQQCPLKCGGSYKQHRTKRCSDCFDSVREEDSFFDHKCYRSYCPLCIGKCYAKASSKNVALYCRHIFTKEEIKSYLDTFCRNCKRKMVMSEAAFHDNKGFCVQCDKRPRQRLSPELDPLVLCSGCLKVVKKGEKSFKIGEDQYLCGQCHSLVSQVVPSQIEQSERSQKIQGEVLGDMKKEQEVIPRELPKDPPVTIAEEVKQSPEKETKIMSLEENTQPQQTAIEKPKKEDITNQRKKMPPEQPSQQQNDHTIKRRRSSDQILQHVSIPVLAVDPNTLISCTVCNYDILEEYAIMGTKTETIMCRACFVLKSNQSIGFKKAEVKEEQPRYRHATTQKRNPTATQTKKPKQNIFSTYQEPLYKYKEPKLQNTFSYYQQPLYKSRQIGAEKKTFNTSKPTYQVNKCEKCSTTLGIISKRLQNGKMVKLCQKCYLYR